MTTGNNNPKDTEKTMLDSFIDLGGPEKSSSEVVTQRSDQSIIADFELIEPTEEVSEISAQSALEKQEHVPGYLEYYFPNLFANIEAARKLTQPNPRIEQAKLWVPTINSAVTTGSNLFKLGSLGFLAYSAPVIVGSIAAANIAVAAYDKVKGNRNYENTQNMFGFSMYGLTAASAVLQPWAIPGMVSIVSTKSQNLIRGTGIALAGIDVPRPLILPVLAATQMAIKAVRFIAPKYMSQETLVERTVSNLTSAVIDASETGIYNIWSSIAHSITGNVTSAASDILRKVGIQLEFPSIELNLQARASSFLRALKGEKLDEIDAIIDDFEILDPSEELEKPLEQATSEVQKGSLLRDFTYENVVANISAANRLFFETGETSQPLLFAQKLKALAPTVNAALSAASNVLKVGSIVWFWAKAPFIFSAAATATGFTAVYDYATDNKSFENTKNVLGFAMQIFTIASPFIAPYATLGLASMSSAKTQDIIRGTGIAIAGVDIPKPLVLPVLFASQIALKIARSVAPNFMSQETFVDRMVLTLADKGIALADYTLYNIWSNITHAISANVFNTFTDLAQQSTRVASWLVPGNQLSIESFEDLGGNVKVTKFNQASIRIIEDYKEEQKPASVESTTFRDMILAQQKQKELGCSASPAA